MKKSIFFELTPAIFFTAGAYIFPIVILFVYTYKLNGNVSIFNTLNFQIFKFTTYQAVLSTMLAVAMGLPGAYLIGRTKFKFKGIFMALSTVPFVMPSISMTLGFISFFGHSGVLNAYFLWPIFRVRFEPLFTLLGVVMGIEIEKFHFR